MIFRNQEMYRRRLACRAPTTSTLSLQGVAQLETAAQLEKKPANTPKRVLAGSSITYVD